MKKIIIIICLFSISLNAQNKIDCNIKENNIDKHLYFAVDLNNRESEQIIHIENHDLAKFLIKMKINNGKKVLLRKKYKVRNISFSLEPLKERLKDSKGKDIDYYIKKIKLVGFCNEENDKQDERKVCKDTNTKKCKCTENSKKEYQIKIIVVKGNKSNISANKIKLKPNQTNIIFNRSNIIDIKICLKKINKDKSFKIEVLSDERKKSLGSHICKSRVTFN